MIVPEHQHGCRVSALYAFIYVYFTGTRFGQGVYFARDASLSLYYTKKGDLQRYMYLVKVLIGQYCQGDGEMKVPPPKDSNRPEILYDSTVDKTVNPEQFVIYYDNQCYPDYLITFHVL